MEEVFFGIIYRVTNKINGKVYIGQTVKKLGCRMSEHYCSNRGYYFHRALKKYSKSDFKWERIHSCGSREEMNKMEVYYIDKYNSFGSGGYNLNIGGNGNTGMKTSLETRAKQSKSKKELYSISKHHRIGTKHSEDSKKLMSDSVKGQRHSRYGKFGNNNPASRMFVITKPDGVEFVIKGLYDFCREYNEEKLAGPNLSACARGIRVHHKKYKCRYYNENNDKHVRLLEDIK